MSEEQLNTDVVNSAAGSTADELIRQVEFGIYFREARQAIGLTTADVADRLKLHEDIIKALENSRIDVLPAAAFTQGYIKAYAKLLKISPDEVMRAYDVMVPNKVAALNINSGLPPERSSRDSVVKITSFVLIALAFVLFIFWIQQSGFELSGNFTQAPAITQEPIAEDVQSDPYPADMLSGDPVAVMDAASANVSQEPVQTAVVSDKKIESGNKPAITGKSEIKIDGKLPEKPAATTQIKPKSAAVEVTKPELKIEAAVTGSDFIRLLASSESWAEIQDADNNRLYYSLLKAGDDRTIKGRAPFRVFLGNAPSVAVQINNQPVDINNYIRQNKIAHVKITAKATTQTGGPRDAVNQVIDQFIPESPGAIKTE